MLSIAWGKFGMHNILIVVFNWLSLIILIDLLFFSF
jgi:hypothetical protein